MTATRVWFDPNRTYSAGGVEEDVPAGPTVGEEDGGCAHFDPADLSLEQAQTAEIDLNLDKLDLKPGMTLLDIGCGWGATMRRAMEKYDVNVIGLTLSKNEQAYTAKLLDEVDSRRSHDVQLRGWDEFSNPVDRIVSIEAFEHFGFDRYDDFFKNCASIMPADGRMTIQSTTGYHPTTWPSAVFRSRSSACVRQVHPPRSSRRSIPTQDITPLSPRCCHCGRTTSRP